MSTGLPELDEIIQGVHPGDNIVWQMDSIDDYISFVHPYCRYANDTGKKLVYFRFADHPSVLPENVKADIYQLHPEAGFESFISEIFGVIESSGPAAYYVFDCLSELSVDWYSDSMLANFFMLACPYLYDYDTVTYFALLRNRHITRTINAIHNTAQVIIDVYKNGPDIFLQPLKVYKRHTNTMYMLHHWENNKFIPVTKSITTSEILHDIPHPWLDFTISQQDMWNKIINRAVEIQKSLAGKPDYREKPEYKEYKHRLLRMMVTRDERLLSLADKHFELSDLIDIGKHMVGTGQIGGKTVGMLLARSILAKQGAYWKTRIEPHDSFFIGSDVFYTYLIMSKCWWARWKQKNSEQFLDGAEESHNRLLSGAFPAEIQDQFKEILNYFGQSPIIVRSSSLLEDAYGNSFSGKYDSIFCANQGTPEERLEMFMSAVKQVYASTMNPEALLYRHNRGLLDNDEQMALLVQRVSGSIYGKYFFPQAAGVGFSYNLYAWNKDIDPKAGVLRMVSGLGTRAVERIDDDYTRIVAINEPGKRPESDLDEIKKYSQRKLDLLNLETNKLESEYFTDILKSVPDYPVNLFASRDNTTGAESWIITFTELLASTKFVDDMKNIFRILQEAYEYPVDIEFTVNFEESGEYKINLLQCRPYQVKIGIGVVKEPGKISKNNLILKTNGPIIGSSVHKLVDKLIYIVPSVYGKLPEKDRYQVAHVIGKLNSLNKDKKDTVMLVGPGRWGTSTPALGVPVQLGEINNISVLCELAEMNENLIPEVSLGTHFFNDLVELDILYMALNPANPENHINRELLSKVQNQLVKYLPDSAKWADTVKVIEINDKSGGIYLNVNAIEQKAVCYRE